MSLNQLQNCPRCGTLFVKGMHNMCTDCYNKIEQSFETVRKYLRNRDNRSSDIHDLSENTGVSVNQIRQFILQNRLNLSELPNMGYPCEHCETPIRDGKFCRPCQSKFSKELGGVYEEELKRKEQEKFKIKDKGYFQQNNRGS